MSVPYLSSQALEDIENIFRYVAERNLDAARALRTALMHACQTLADHPYLARERPQTGPGARILPVRRHYLIVYRITDEGVYIVRVLDAAQDMSAKINE